MCSQTHSDINFTQILKMISKSAMQYKKCIPDFLIELSCKMTIQIFKIVWEKLA